MRLPSSPHVRSPFVQTVSTCGGEIIWHSLFGNAIQVTSDTLKLLRCFGTPCTPEATVSMLSLDWLSRQALAELIKASFIIPTTVDERQLLERRINLSTHAAESGERLDNLSLVVTDACNFACKYCIHARSLGGTVRVRRARKQMEFEVATAAVDSFLQIASRNGRTSVEINFGGGEPLLNWRVISATLDYCRNQYGDRYEFEFSINTNLSLITHSIARKLQEYQVIVSTSLDGGRTANDTVRVYRNTKGTFNEIVGGLAVLDDCGHPAKSLSVTIDDNNFDSLDNSVFTVAEKFGITSVRVDSDVLGGTTRPIGDVVEKIQEMRRCGAGVGIEVPGFWLRPAENLNETPVTDDVAFCGAARGNSICVSPSGELFACGYSSAPLGHLSAFSEICQPGSPYARLIKRRSVGQETECHGCFIEGQCAGGCEITREYARRQGITISRMCSLYRALFVELLKEQAEESLIDAKGGEVWQQSRKEELKPS